MYTNYGDVQSRFVNTLRTQDKTDPRSAGFLPCPYCQNGTTFQTMQLLWAHAQAEHASMIMNMAPNEARDLVGNLALKLR